MAVIALTAILSGPPATADVAGAGGPDPGEDPGRDDTAEPDGRFLYQRDCASCHGDKGQGSPEGDALTEVGPAEVDYAVSSGRMPIAAAGAIRRRRESPYTDEERAALVDYMREFIAEEPDIPEVNPDDGDLALGGELYRNQCAACHQWAGVGGALLGLEAPPVVPATALEMAEAIRAGPSTMPAFSEAALSDEEVNHIVAYMEYLRDPEDRGGYAIWHLGPLAEGLVAMVVGFGLLMMASYWIGDKE